MMLAKSEDTNNDGGDVKRQGGSEVAPCVKAPDQRKREKTSRSKLPLRLLPPIDEHGPFSELPKSRLPESKSKPKYYTHDRRYNYSSSGSRFPAENKPAVRSDSQDNDAVIHYLDNHQGLLEAYIIDRVSSKQLERWLNRKINLERGKAVYPANVSQRYKLNSRNYFSTLENKIQKNCNEQSAILELAFYFTLSVGVDAYRVFKVNPDNPSSVQYFVMESPNNLETLTELSEAEYDAVKLISDVANNKKRLRLSRGIDATFPNMPGSLKETFGIQDKEANYLLYQPIPTSGKIVYVFEMWRINYEFDDNDQEICASFCCALHYCNTYLDKERKIIMSDALLGVVKAIFEEIVSLDQLVKVILKSAQKLVNADRASLFLVDSSTCELVSTVFDLKLDNKQEGVKETTIRMPLTQGIAGYVALSGETMNIRDAYSDHRFNSEVDEITGYKTKSILCMPIKVGGTVIGVVQMVNKLNNNSFDHSDEDAFKKFSTLFGLALHNARLYNEITRKEQSYKIALEVLSYHNTCKEHEVQELETENRPLPVNLDDFYLDPYKLDSMQKCKAVMRMFDDLFDLSKFDSMSVMRFILTVRKNYRMVPYHNFDHGWTVAHAMYMILKNDHLQRFDYKMRLALFVACLCHDLDHRGYTNQYMNEISSPLAAMYTTSPLEHHHFNITVIILQQDGHNIFSHLSSEDYKDILRYIKLCILATDLAVFFPNLNKFNEIFDENSPQKFNWENSCHRDLAMSLSMTGADLSASAKPWKVQFKTAKVIFEEFYEQGDKERAAGKTPIPMMDRNKPEEQPSNQAAFIRQICNPCYSMLYKILPHTKPMYEMSLKNFYNWQTKANGGPENFEDDNEDTST